MCLYPFYPFAERGMAFSTEIHACRICGGDALEPVLDLGNQVIASQFPASGEPTPPCIPLILVQCRHPECGLVQLKHSAIPNELYGKTYGYRSGLNETMRNHLKALVEEAWALLVQYGVPLDATREVLVDIGSNDATLLKAYDSVVPPSLVPSLKRVGIDPTGTQFKDHYPPEIHLIPDYFSAAVFHQWADSSADSSPSASSPSASSPAAEAKAKILTTISMFYDLPDPVGFAREVASILADDGIWIMEQSYMPTMVARRSFDTVCHEHLEYYTLQDIQHIAARVGLRIVQVSMNDCNGGSFRVALCHLNAPYESNAIPTDPPVDFKQFQHECQQQRAILTRFLSQQVAQGKTVYLYGASTKGNTLLQYYDLDDTMIRGAAERNPTKYGCRTPKTNIPILPEDDVRALRPDFMLVLPWHFKQAFLEREQDYLAEGGQFIFPLPSVQLVSGSTQRVALMTGITGFIGTAMKQKLLSEGYRIYGLTRQPIAALARLAEPGVFYLHASPDELASAAFWDEHIALIQPTVIYHFAADANGFQSSNRLDEIVQTNGQMDVALLSALVKRPRDQWMPVFVSSSVELWRGLSATTLQDDPVSLPLPAPVPKNPYGIAKALLYHTVQFIRTHHAYPVFQGLFSNIDAPWRAGEAFALNKIRAFLQSVPAAAAAPTPLRLGNTRVYRDWLHVEDAVEGIYTLMTRGTPGDYLVASGVSQSLETVLKSLFEKTNRHLVPSATDPNVYCDKDTGAVWVETHPQTHPDPDDYGHRTYIPAKLHALGWSPAKQIA